MNTEAMPADTNARPVRTNADGDACPEWCITPHDKYNFHASKNIMTMAPQYHSCHVRALDYGHSDSRPLVSISAAGMFDLPPREALDLARLIDQLATATPEEHAALAEIIRQAATVAKEGRAPIA